MENGNLSDIEDWLHCESCGHQLRPERGFHVCPECGLVRDSYITRDHEMCLTKAEINGRESDVRYRSRRFSKVFGTFYVPFKFRAAENKRLLKLARIFQRSGEAHQKRYTDF